MDEEAVTVLLEGLDTFLLCAICLAASETDIY